MLIDRSSVKQQSKDLIRSSRPSLISASLLYVLLSAVIEYLSLRLTGVDMDTVTRIMTAASEGRTETVNVLMAQAMPGGWESLIDLLLHLALSIVGVGFTLFVLNSIRSNTPVVGNLLDGFGMLPRLLWLLILQTIVIVLWSLLFVVPGIIAAYRYSLSVYIMIDHPEYGAIECMRESRRMTNGFKAQLFKLDLSFLLWLLLGAMPVIGYAIQIYLMPYMECAKALFYEKIRAAYPGNEMVMEI